MERKYEVVADDEDYLCQACGRICLETNEPSVWRPDITGHKSAGNVCPTCLQEFERNKITD